MTLMDTAERKGDRGKLAAVLNICGSKPSVHS
jgi:hypothetical protein